MCVYVRGICLSMIIGILLPGCALAAKPTGTLPLMKNVKRIVFVGDSITDASPWPDWVVETLRANGYPHLEFRNAAVCGDTTTLVMARMDRDVLAYKPDMIILLIGTNDAKGTPEAYRTNLEKMLGTFAATGAKIVQLTLPPALNGMGDNVDKNNDVIREITRKHGIPLGDPHALFLQEMRAGKTLLCDDHLHPNLDGWRAIGRATLDALGFSGPMLEKVPAFPGTIADWYSGPALGVKSIEEFLKDHGEMITPAFDPSKAGWKPYDAKSIIEKASWADVGAFQRGALAPIGYPVPANSFGIACTVVKVAADTKYVMHVSDFATMAVWLNGEQVFYNANRIHGLHPDAERVTVTLKKGENRIVAVSNIYFYVTLTKE